MIFIFLLITYFVLLLLLGFWAHKKTGKTPEDYFLADRKFGAPILFFTLAATNFSAFTFLGFAGNAYKSGFGQYAIMAFGTGFMAIMFYVIGRKIWRIGKDKGYITPPELIGKKLDSITLRTVFMSVMIIFTIPYLAVQAIGAGYLIQNIANINWEIGAVLTIFVIMFYVLLGGMKGSGWSDVIQGVVMIFALLIAVFFIASSLGGVEMATSKAFESSPELFSRPGGGNYFIPQIWFSFMILWMFADPMFPQLFSRFYTAKDDRSLKTSMFFYPIVVSFLFLLPVLIGVWAHATNLNIPAGKEDMVLPLMVESFAPEWAYAFVMIGALAALMSTADSQLLSLSTMLTRDLPKIKNYISETMLGKLFVVLLSLFAVSFVVLGYDPNVGIMGTLVKTTFSGLAVLFPTTVAVLYWKKVSKYGCIFSIIIGEFSIFLFEFNFLPTIGFLSAIWAVLIAAIVLVSVSYLTTAK
ncbi:MAG: sodium:solute symporter family protein [Candidatus Thermoplasmatota archaeon]